MKEGWLKRELICAQWSVAAQPEWMRKLGSSYEKEDEDHRRQVVAHLREAQKSLEKLADFPKGIHTALVKALNLSQQWNLETNED